MLLSSCAIELSGFLKKRSETREGNLIFLATWNEGSYVLFYLPAIA